MLKRAATIVICLTLAAGITALIVSLPALAATTP
jgi:hypothetical protein